MSADYDYDKVDEVVLALLSLTMHADKSSTRTWKGHDWEVLNRLHQKGYISDPATKAKSVVITEEGIKRSQELFKKYFSQQGTNAIKPGNNAPPPIKDLLLAPEPRFENVVPSRKKLRRRKPEAFK